MRVFIGIHEHRHGSDVLVFDTMEAVSRWRQAIAAEEWKNWFDDNDPPADPEQAADTFFGDDDVREWFDIEEREVVTGKDLDHPSSMNSDDIWRIGAPPSNGDEEEAA